MGKEVAMKSHALHRWAIAILAAAALSGSTALARDEARTARATPRTAARQQTARKTAPFKSERTDSWLCNYVSPFFCSNLFPTLSSSSSGNNTSTAPSVPDRSRHN